MRLIGFYLAVLALIFPCGVLQANEISELREHVNSNPGDLKSVYQMAQKLHQKKRFKESLKYFKYLVKKRPQDQKLRYQLARGYFLAGRVDESLMICQKLSMDEIKKKCKTLSTRARERFPDSYDLFRARRLLSQRNLAGAEEILEELLTQDVEDPEFRLLLAKIHYFKKQYDFSMDHGSYVKSRLGKARAGRLLARLRAVGTRVLAEVNATKLKISDEEKFCSRYFLSLKLIPEETERRAGGFKRSCGGFYMNRIEEEGGLFEDYYRLGYFHDRMQEKDKAQETYQKALEEAADDVHYASLEFLISRLKSGGQKKEVVIDLVSSVGGAEAYKLLQDAALKADKITSVDGESSQGVARLGVDKEEFVAQIENYKRKIQRASSQAEKKALVEELSAKYGHLFKDPKTRKELDRFLKTDEGKALKEKYRGQIEKAKEEGREWDE